MPTNPTMPTLVGGLGLLERAIGYTRMSLQLVTPADLDHRTPCRRWDLAALLGHIDDSMQALQEAADTGYVEMAPSARQADTPELVTRLRNRACSLLGAWTSHDGADLVSIAGSPLTAGVLAMTGALEIAVHGWDVARSCAVGRPLPAALAEELWEVAPALVGPGDRPARFAEPVGIPVYRPAADRLLGFLGRTP